MFLLHLGVGLSLCILDRFVRRLFFRYFGMFCFGCIFRSSPDIFWAPILSPKSSRGTYRRVCCFHPNIYLRVFPSWALSFVVTISLSKSNFSSWFYIPVLVLFYHRPVLHHHKLVIMFIGIFGNKLFTTLISILTFFPILVPDGWWYSAVLRHYIFFVNFILSSLTLILYCWSLWCFGFKYFVSFLFRGSCYSVFCVSVWIRGSSTYVPTYFYYLKIRKPNFL